MKRIAIFASGSGSNAQNIIEYFTVSGTVKVELILTNKRDAYVLERAKKFQIPTYVFDRQQFYETNTIVNQLANLHIDMVVLAGFLWLVPTNLLKQFPNRIINIHPALLPSYGGKGMYGDKVHEAVIANKDSFSGITIHYVNERYDAGDIIFQQKCEIDSDDTAATLAQKVHSLEYEYFPKIIQEVLGKL